MRAFGEFHKKQEADLTLGGDEGKECTYENGYMKRQAIFSCLTCVPQGNAGVCTACSLSCHDGHEVISKVGDLVGIKYFPVEHLKPQKVIELKKIE